MFTYPGHLYIDENRVQMLAKFADFWTDGRLISLLVCICAQIGGFRDTYVCLFQCK